MKQKFDEQADIEKREARRVERMRILQSQPGMQLARITRPQRQTVKTLPTKLTKSPLRD